MFQKKQFDFTRLSFDTCFHVVGVEVYLVGIGQQYNATDVLQFASKPSNVYLAPNADNLKERMTDILDNICQGKETLCRKHLI